MFQPGSVVSGKQAYFFETQCGYLFLRSFISFLSSLHSVTQSQKTLTHLLNSSGTIFCLTKILPSLHFAYLINIHISSSLKKLLTFAYHRFFQEKVLACLPAKAGSGSPSVNTRARFGWLKNAYFCLPQSIRRKHFFPGKQRG